MRHWPEVEIDSEIVHDRTVLRVRGHLDNHDPDFSQINAMNLEYYKWRMHAFAENRMTHDKTILQLSSAGIGLIVTLLTAFKEPSLLAKFFLALPALLFGATIWYILKTFRLNSDSLNTDDYTSSTEISKKMRGIDIRVQRLFAGAVLLMFIAGAILLFHG